MINHNFQHQQRQQLVTTGGGGGRELKRLPWPDLPSLDFFAHLVHCTLPSLDFFLCTPCTLLTLCTLHTAQLRVLCTPCMFTVHFVHWPAPTSFFAHPVYTVSVLHQDEGGIGKSIPDAQKISRDQRDFPRAKPEGNLKGRGKSRGRRGWISRSLIICREVLILTLSILPCSQGRIC